MIKRYEFIERVLFLLRKNMEERLPDEAFLDEMFLKLKEVLNEFNN